MSSRRSAGLPWQMQGIITKQKFTYRRIVDTRTVLASNVRYNITPPLIANYVAKVMLSSATMTKHKQLIILLWKNQIDCFGEISDLSQI